MKQNFLTLFSIAFIGFATQSCGGETQTSQESEQPDSSTVVEVQETWGFSSHGGNSYQVPSPNELFAIIKGSNVPYKENLVNTEPVNYESRKTLALNFGRLTADIAYTSSYEKYQESMANFENLRRVGDQLGISYVFDELMVNRVKTNMANADSLEVISTESYQRIIQQLEENEAGSILAIIAAGGFVESVYILSNMVGEYTPDNPIIQRLADQKLVLENIIDYLNQYADEDERVQEVLTELQPISDIYLNMDEERISSQKATSNGKTILGGSRVIMTKDEFDRLKQAATEYRNTFSNANEG
ncbi:MAG: hypothetical protein Kow0075_12830 [Salibacteraceae bacterium]